MWLRRRSHPGRIVAAGGLVAADHGGRAATGKQRAIDP
jgi:hypothetical protein